MANMESKGEATFDCLRVVYLDNPINDMVDNVVSQAVKATTSDSMTERPGPDECGGLQVTATTVFQFNDANSLFVTGETSVQPITFGSPDVTHVTGAIPGTNEENVEGGTGVYADATGSVRLSGAVNMANMESKGEATFDCLWVMDIAKKEAGGKGATSSLATRISAENALGAITLVALFFLV